MLASSLNKNKLRIEFTLMRFKCFKQSMYSIAHKESWRWTYWFGKNLGAQGEENFINFAHFSNCICYLFSFGRWMGRKIFEMQKDFSWYGSKDSNPTQFMQNLIQLGSLHKFKTCNDDIFQNKLKCVTFYKKTDRER